MSLSGLCLGAIASMVFQEKLPKGQTNLRKLRNVNYFCIPVHAIIIIIIYLYLKQVRPLSASTVLQ